MFRTSTTTWEVRDTGGRRGREDQAMQPARTHRRWCSSCHDRWCLLRARRRCAAAPGTAARPYREYVLCNEVMIESWPVGTDSVVKEIAAGARWPRRRRSTSRCILRRAAGRTAGTPTSPLVWPSLVPLSGAKERVRVGGRLPEPQLHPGARGPAAPARTLQKLPQRGPPPRTARRRGSRARGRSRSRRLPPPPPAAGRGASTTARTEVRECILRAKRWPCVAAEAAAIEATSLAARVARGRVAGPRRRSSRRTPRPWRCSIALRRGRGTPSS